MYVASSFVTPAYFRRRTEMDDSLMRDAIMDLIFRQDLLPK